MKKPRSPHLTKPVKPFLVEPGLSTEETLSRMEHISFQGRNLAKAYQLWKTMLNDETFIFFGLAGALSAGGLRLLIGHLIENRYIDCVVSTGANLYHDLHETRGGHHFIGSPDADDSILGQDKIDRVYDTLIDEQEFIRNDEWIADFSASLPIRRFTSREYLYRLGERLWGEYKSPGILTAAFRARVPIYCPAIADSSIGMGLSQGRILNVDSGLIDTIGDVQESAELVIMADKTASIVIGGGTPKNFINQASVQAEYLDSRIQGHHYALQIITDVPHYGGASGSSLNEAKSWGKIRGAAKHVTVNADATIALPILVTALASSTPKPSDHRRLKTFTLDGEKLR
tara:strand:- start:10203 stop:11234 length:1032 start_codon:yes stop_codon:yes gene_type:complete